MKQTPIKPATANPARQRPLWRCPKCDERFITRNLWHSCGKHTIEESFARSEPQMLPLFKKFAKMVRACGPVRMIPQKTRVVFQVRVRFVAVYPRKSYLECGIALPYSSSDPRVVKIETYAPHFQVHLLHLVSETDLDQQLRSWLHESYQVGEQRFLRERDAETPSLFKSSKTRRTR